MLSFLKREKSKQLEDQLNAAQAQRRTGWENLPEDELFTPAGFSEEQAEATAAPTTATGAAPSVPFSRTSSPWPC